MLRFAHTHDSDTCLPSTRDFVLLSNRDLVLHTYLEAVVLQQPQAPDGGLYVVAAADLLQDCVVRVLNADLLPKKIQQRKNNKTSPGRESICQKRMCRVRGKGEEADAID